MIVPTKNVPSASAILQVEDALSEEQGMPIRLIFLNPDKSNLAKLVWQVTVRPKEKKSSEIEKLMFRAEVQDAQIFGPLLNMDYLADRFASVWNENPQKMFKKAQEALPQGEPGGQVVSPETNLPSPEQAVGGQLRTSMGMTA